MAGNTQIDPRTEGGLFSLLHGLTGYAIAVALLLTILGVLTYLAIDTQQANATNFYHINQDLDGLKMNSPDNHKMWINEKDK
jgi:succinate dehydrogenase/fumarate reductase cytochrome b subunit